MTGPVPVSDASRKAAWRFHDFPYMPDEQTRERWFSGYYDDNRVLQAFARHAERSRLAALDEAAVECDDCWKNGVPVAEISRHILSLKETPDAK